MKIMSIIGTRPDLIKMSELIKKLDRTQYIEHIFVHTGQNYDYELTDIFYNDLDLRKPDYSLEVKSDSLGETIGNVIREVERVLLKEKPQAVVILGDTNSALAAIIVKRLKIPLFHLEAGNRCFDDNVPEEINRRIIDHISDINLVYTSNERTYLLDEGIAKDRIFISGSPMKEILSNHIGKINQSTILNDLKISRREYFLVSIHRNENVDNDKNLTILINTLNEINTKYKLPIIVSAHPHLKKKLSTWGKPLKEIKLCKPFGFIDYNHLQMNAKCVISDSGTISEESAILGFPAITVRNAIERPEAIDAGSILITGIDKENILGCLEIIKPPTTIPSDYATSDFSDRVLKIVLGYTNYVNKYVWRKS